MCTSRLGYRYWQLRGGCGREGVSIELFHIDCGGPCWCWLFYVPSLITNFSRFISGYYINAFAWYNYSWWFCICYFCQWYYVGFDYGVSDVTLCYLFLHTHHLAVVNRRWNDSMAVILMMLTHYFYKSIRVTAANEYIKEWGQELFRIETTQWGESSYDAI
jgi:hypothetical protein